MISVTEMRKRKMQKLHRIVIVGIAAVCVLSIALINIGGAVVDLVVNDGCQVDAVDILPDIGDMHDYNITLSCEDGYRSMEVLTKDPPPTPGEGYNPLRDSTIILGVIGGILLVIGLFLCLLTILEFTPLCGKAPPPLIPKAKPSIII